MRVDYFKNVTMNYSVESFPHPSLNRVINLAYRLANRINEDKRCSKPDVTYEESTTSTGYYNIKIKGKFECCVIGNKLHEKLNEIYRQYDRRVKYHSKWDKSIIDRLVNGVNYKELIGMPYISENLELTYYDERNPSIVYLIPQAAIILHSHIDP